MGDSRFAPPYQRIKQADDRLHELHTLSDEETIAALAAASREHDPLLANVLATEAQNRARRARSIVECMDAPTWAVDGSGRIAYVNPAAERALGWSRAELLGSDAHGALGAVDPQGKTISRAASPLLEVLRTGKVVRRDADSFRRRDGTMLPVSYSIAPITPEPPSLSVQGAVVVFHDGGEAARARTLAARNAALCMASTAAIVELSPEGKVRSWDARAEDLYGSLAGRALRDLVDDPAEADAQLARLHRGQDVARLESRARRADDRDVRVSIGLARKDDVIVSVHEDVTALRRSEALLLHAPIMLVALDAEGAVRAWNEECERVTGITTAEALGAALPWQATPRVDHRDHESNVAARTGGERVVSWSTVAATHRVPGWDWWEVGVDVTQRKLEREELDRRVQDLEQFAYVASHDLKEPLRMVTSYLKLIETRYAKALDDAGREFIGFAVDGASRMQELIDGLLGYSRVTTQGKPIAATASDDALAQALANLALATREARAIVTQESMPSVMADPTQLVQLFQNLLENALKFRGEGPPRIHVAATPAGDEWVFSVQDNGIGIDVKDHARVFRVFERLHSREEYPGSGIGLAICKRIVERHGGRIWIESEGGKGATFRFTLKGAR